MSTLFMLTCMVMLNCFKLLKCYLYIASITYVPKFAHILSHCRRWRGNIHLKMAEVTRIASFLLYEYSSLISSIGLHQLFIKNVKIWWSLDRRSLNSKIWPSIRNILLCNCMQLDANLLSECSVKLKVADRISIF